VASTGDPQVREPRRCLECGAKAAIDYRCLRHHKRWRRQPEELREPLPTACAAIGCKAEIADSEMCAKHIGVWKRKCAAARTRQRNYELLLEDHSAEEALLMATQKCEKSGCLGLPFKRGLCQRHYDSWLKAPADMRCAVERCTQLRRKNGLLCDDHETQHKQVSMETPKGVCGFVGCLKPAASRGLCEAHYKRLQRNGDPTIDRRRRPGLEDPTPSALARTPDEKAGPEVLAKLCSAPRCSMPVMAGNLCVKHIRRQQRRRGASPRTD